MKPKNPKIKTSWAVLLVAAGQSKRLKSPVPKPFLYLDSKRTLLDLCLAAFKRVPGLDYVIIVTRKDYRGRAGQALTQAGLSGIVTLGGDQREDSVWQGLQAVPPGIKTVLVHDAARPFVSTDVIRRVLKETAKSGAAIPVVPVKDTLKVVSGNKVVKTLDRSTLRAVQTPQGFEVSLLKKAFLKLGKRASLMTDDAAVVEAVGTKVKVVDGDSTNFKVTTPDDLKQAKEQLAKKKR
ncbi:MAG TPA: 2-C-methyl-D-erythritol 4-phosphate cytidylyltransferase [bacterium]|nr:2-C-methyl-D-erythritol 4-phosphate cytidylyltransferase [bacterium]